MSILDQTTQPFIGRGNLPLSVLAPQWGASKTQAVTTTPSAAIQLHADTFPRIIRIWAVGCPVRYVLGGSGVAAPSATADGYVAQDQSIETVAAEGENYIRVAAGSGSGSAVVELLR
jgi:hypothetical protein